MQGLGIMSANVTVALLSAGNCGISLRKTTRMAGLCAWVIMVEFPQWQNFITDQLFSDMMHVLLRNDTVLLCIVMHQTKS